MGQLLRFPSASESTIEHELSVLNPVSLEEPSGPDSVRFCVWAGELDTFALRQAALDSLGS